MAWKLDLISEDGSVAETLLLGHLDRSYRLDDGMRIPVYQAIGWCDNCRQFTEIERLKSLTEIDAEISRVKSGDTGARRARQQVQETMGYDLFADDPDADRRQLRMEAEELREWLAVRAWRLVRRSPPRCLRCGSSAIKDVDHRPEPVRHPHTHQTFQIVCRAHVSLSVHWSYTPEGLEITSR